MAHRTSINDLYLSDDEMYTVLALAEEAISYEKPDTSRYETLERIRDGITELPIPPEQIDYECDRHEISN